VTTRVGAGVEDLLRRLAPQVLGTLVRRYDHFDLCEDAVQEALLAASVQWPEQGVPENPRAWLITVASRRLMDALRSDTARRRREETAAARVPSDELHAPGPGDELAPEDADTLTLLFLCAHPALSPASQLALTLRAVGGLTTAEIARAFLVPEATIAQRITRAKRSIKASGEVAGLLALMLLTDARRATRTRHDGSLVPLAEQDRDRWNHDAIEEGLAIVTDALSRAPVGPYQLQAAIAAVHAEATHADDTDWPQILTLYELLNRISPNPMITLNQAVAVAMVRGPQAGLDLLSTLDEDDRIGGHHRLEAVRAHLLEMTGDRAAARLSYRAAARRTTSLPERRYLENRAARLMDADP
jgi:RNA polymerase sigma factor (sigma-70 family)